MSPPLPILAFSGYHVNPLLKKDVFTLKNHIFKKNTLEKVGIWSRGSICRLLVPKGDPLIFRSVGPVIHAPDAPQHLSIQVYTLALQGRRIFPWVAESSG